MEEAEEEEEKLEEMEEKDLNGDLHIVLFLCFLHVVLSGGYMEYSERK